MKIIRNGIEYELTENEMGQAYYEFERMMYRQYLVPFLEREFGDKLTDELIEIAVDDYTDSRESGCDDIFSLNCAIETVWIAIKENE